MKICKPAWKTLFALAHATPLTMDILIDKSLFNSFIGYISISADSTPASHGLDMLTRLLIMPARKTKKGKPDTKTTEADIRRTVNFLIEKRAYLSIHLLAMKFHKTKAGSVYTVCYFIFIYCRHWQGFILPY